MSAPRDRPTRPPVEHPFSVAAVVSAHRPGAELVENLRAVVAQTDRVVVVDDGSGPDFDHVFEAAASLGAQVLRRRSNDGIAAALNAGVAELLDGDGARPGPDGVLFLDQDSTVEPRFVEALTRAYLTAYHASLPVAGSVPEYFGDTSQVSGRSHGHLIARKPIQSGMLLAADALRELGPFRADYFIDLVDTEYDLRVEAHGLRFTAAPGVRLPHALGRQVGVPGPRGPLRGPGGAPLRFTVSAPFRYYYRARNRVALNREYRRRRPLAIGRDTVLELRHYLIVWLAVRQRGELLRILRAGRRDARDGLMGPIPPAVRAAADRLDWRHPL